MSRKVWKPQGQFRAGGGELRKDFRRQHVAQVGAGSALGWGSQPASTAHCWPRGKEPSRWEAMREFALFRDLKQDWAAEKGGRGKLGGGGWGGGLFLKVTESLKDSGLEEA